MKSENASLQRDLITLKERVITLEASAGKSSTQCTDGVPQLLLKL